MDQGWLQGRLHALCGSNLDKAQAVFAAAIKHRPRDPVNHSAAYAGAGAVAGVGSIRAVRTLMNHVCDAAIIRTNQNDSVIAFLHKKQNGIVPAPLFSRPRLAIGIA